MNIELEYKRGLYICRRECRLDDNNALLYSLDNCMETVVAYIFDKRQILEDRNPFYGSNCVQFMIESLKELNTLLIERGSRIFYFFGDYPNILEEVLDSIQPNLLSLNFDYSPFAKKRDDEIKTECEKRKIEFKTSEDLTLVPSYKEILSKSNTGKFFTLFMPFFKHASLMKVPEVRINNYKCFISGNVKFENEFKGNLDDFYTLNENLEVRGGRAAGLEILNNLEKFKNYNEEMNFPIIDTTKLSAYIRFGTVSIREVYHSILSQLGPDFGEQLKNQIYWREFYYFILLFNPIVLKGPFKTDYAKIIWNDDEVLFRKWTDGLTGFPIVDASMRQLNRTGFIHNRLRMIVGHFLVKSLLIDWRYGEKYFAKVLVDYDVGMNSGGWQWCAGCGADSLPYFRMFDPKVQSLKYDPDCLYIKKWIPELKEIPAKAIHDWESHHSKYDVDFPTPVVQLHLQKTKFLKMYKDALEVKGHDQFGLLEKELDDYESSLLNFNMEVVKYNEDWKIITKK